MTLCEMCGKEARLVTAEVEGGELRVCSLCARYGKVKKEVTSFGVHKPSRRKIASEIPQFKVVENYSSLIRSARENTGMSQEVFAKFLNERASVVAKWEQGHRKPKVNAARSVGKRLRINLVEKEEREEGKSVQVPTQKKSDEFTLGDFIKVRKRK